MSASDSHFIKHLTQYVFAFTLILSLVSAGLIILNLGATSYIILLTVSLLVNGASIYRSEHKGFSSSKRMRRAFEPARNFNLGQIIILYFVIMGQCGLAIYMIFLAQA